MLLLAHRGASADAPENTLEAFEEAVTQKADGVELDAQVCGSGEVIVCHDESLERLAGKHWDVRRTPYEQLREADVGTPLGFTKARIPRLEEVIDALPAHFLVNIELKCDTVEDGGLAAKVAELVKRRRLQDRVVVSSFNALCLFRLAALAPEVRRGFLIDPDKAFLPQAYGLVPLVSTHSVHPFHAQCTPSRMAHWRGTGLRVAAWTVDDVEQGRGLRHLGCSYLITNRPAVMREGLGAAHASAPRG